MSCPGFDSRVCSYNLSARPTNEALGISSSFVICQLAYVSRKYRTRAFPGGKEVREWETKTRRSPESHSFWNLRRPEGGRR